MNALMYRIAALAGLLLAYGTLVADPIQLTRGPHLASQDKVRPHLKAAAATPDPAERQIAQATPAAEPVTARAQAGLRPSR